MPPLNITLLPDGTPEEQEHARKALALAEKLHTLFTIEDPTEAVIIEAFALIFVNRAADQEAARRFAVQAAMAMNTYFNAKRRAAQ